MAPRFETQLRVTKYDRDDPRYAEDWTSVSDVGDTFFGKVLTLERYLEVEASHLRVVAAFLEEAEVETTVVRAPERYDAHWWPGEGDSLSRLETADVVREMLRERAWCRLEGPRDTYVHVGYDYYLYLGGNVSCGRTIALSRDIGLFVDSDFLSPHHVDPTTGEFPC
jgi:hypothetical protein